MIRAFYTIFSVLYGTTLKLFGDAIRLVYSYLVHVDLKRGRSQV